MVQRKKTSKDEYKQRLMQQTGIGAPKPVSIPDENPDNITLLHPAPQVETVRASQAPPPIEAPRTLRDEPPPEVPEPIRRNIIGDALQETRIGMRSDEKRKQKAFVLERTVAKDIEEFSKIVGIHESRLVNSILKAAMDAGTAPDEFKPHLTRMRAIRALLEEQQIL